MSNVMLLAALRCQIAVDDPVAVAQLVGRAREAANRIEADAALIAQLEEALKSCAAVCGGHTLSKSELINSLLKAEAALTAAKNRK